MTIPAIPSSSSQQEEVASFKVSIPAIEDETTTTTTTTQSEESESSSKPVTMTEEESSGVKSMMAALTQEEIDSFPDPYMPLRHFRAEKGDVTKAIRKLQATIRWRKEFGVLDLVRAFDEKNNKSINNSNEKSLSVVLQNENETGKIYVRGYDSEGRALMYMRPGKENTLNETNNLRHLVFQLEKAIACSSRHNHSNSKICIIIDYDGFALRKAPPMSTSKRTLDILQNHYPERMHRAYICNPPFVFRTFWTLIQPFIDPVTKEKICFVSSTKGMQRLVRDVGGDESQLESCCTGTKQTHLRPFDSKEYLLELPFDVAFDESISTTTTT